MSFDFQRQLQDGLIRLDLEIPEPNILLLERYFQELKKWNRRVNLIAKSASDEHVIENHFLDSLTLLPFVNDGDHLLDIGTGGGFPGLVCKVARSGLRVSLVEPRKKRVSFLRHIVRTLGVSGVEIYSERIEDEGGLTADKTISHVTSRAVAEIGPFLQLVENFSATNAEIVMMKGPKWPDELKAAERVVKKSKYTLRRVEECTLPFSGASRSLLFFTLNE